jgi:hypothetical protein
MNKSGADCSFLAKLGLAGFALLVGLPAQIWFSWLRETPVFWMNEGGYPVWLREVVLVAFYPLMAINVLVLLVYGVLIMAAPPRRRRSLWIQFTVFALIAGAIFFDGVWTLLEHC